MITNAAKLWIDRQGQQKQENMFLLNKVKDKKLRIKYFNNILSFADSVIEESERLKQSNGLHYKEHPILDVIRLLGRNINTDYYMHLLCCGIESELQYLSIDDNFFEISTPITEDGKKFYDVIKEITYERTLDLRKDIVLSWPWHRRRLCDCISMIGEGRLSGRWRQDNNHSVTLLLPFGVSFVSGGNHSLTTGIIQGEGKVKADYIYDISPVYEFVKCDSEKFYSIKNNTFLFCVRSLELAAIFEIGRKMAEKNISF